MLNRFHALRTLARRLLRTPGFSAVAVITLAVAIGANAALFSVVHAVLIEPLPYPDPDRLVGLWHTAPGIGIPQFEQSDGTYAIYRKLSRTLSGLGLYDTHSVNLTGDGEPERLRASGVTASLFGVLEVPPALGRGFVKADERPGSEPVVVLTHDLWTRRFGGRRDALGASVRLDGVARRIVGVMPAGFRFPTAETELWVPIPIDPAHLNVGNFNFNGLGRLRPGATPEAVARELTALTWRIPEEFPNEEITPGMLRSARFAAVAHWLRDDVVGEVERALWLLLGSVGVILLIACANVANLFLVRAEGRWREVAVRTALGASRAAIARSFLGESAVLALVGGALGLALAWSGLKALLALGPEGIPRLEEIAINPAVLGFTLALSLLAALLSGGVAALRYGSPELSPALKEGGRGGSSGQGRHRARNVLVVAQMALALVLLVASGLMVRSFWRLHQVDPGVEPRGVLTVGLALPDAEYGTAAATARFVNALLERVRAIPGVVEAGTVTLLPLAGGGSNSAHTIEDHPLPPDAVPPILDVRFATREYFRAIGIPLLSGRTFGRPDPAKRSDEVLVSRALEEHFWPHGSALGKRLAQGMGRTGRWATIVGVVGSVRDDGLHKPPTETVYYPLMRQEPQKDEPEWVPNGFTLVVRTRSGDPLALAPRVRDAIWSLDRNLPVARVRTMEKVVEESTARTSFTMLLLVIAAAMALLLGGVGNYGVISYVVAQRTREIGVRMALGARQADVATMVLRHGLLVALAGVAIGLAGAFAVTRLMQALLFEVSPTDPRTFGAVSALLVAVALLASYLPARRAAAVDPLEAIRYE